nr:MAG TPA: hypothetical protein [Caudoviricetes sp.]
MPIEYNKYFCICCAFQIARYGLLTKAQKCLIILHICNIINGR